MSARNFTQIVTPNTCLGDSLATFNANFSALDYGLNTVPTIVAGNGTKANNEYTEQNDYLVHITASNSFNYVSKFDYTLASTSDNLALTDGTTFPVTTFPYVTATASDAPLATFSTIALTNRPPKVTLFWTASGMDNVTLYATNSAYGTNSSQIAFNGPVTALLSSGNVLYVGGEFTTVGGVDCKKFCAINLTGGTQVITGGLDTYNYEYTGSLITNPLSALGDLETTGTVHAIADTGTYLIVVGSFISQEKGRGLTILNKITNDVYPFYVNGVVNDVKVIGTDLYIAGKFDYINYSAQSVSIITGKRVYTNGIIKISLELISYGPSCIITSFADTISNLFEEPAEITSLASVNSFLYIGGIFTIKNDYTLVSINLARLNEDGTHYTSWKQIVGGPVYTLAVDNQGAAQYLYVGGEFNSCHAADYEFYANPRINNSFTAAYNAVRFNISLADIQYDGIWKPIFNGAVTQFAFHNNQSNSYVYCYGKFTQVNSTSVSYIAAVTKANAGDAMNWQVNLQNSSQLVNQGLVRYGTSIIVGGAFTKVNNKPRTYLARINGVDEGKYSANDRKLVAWDIGSQVCSIGTGLSIDFTSYASLSSYPGALETVNQTPLPINSQTFKGYKEGDLIRFFIKRRKGTNPTADLKSSAYVIGCKVDFNE